MNGTTGTIDSTAHTVATRGLSRSYRGTLALDNVTIEFAPNVITGLLGRNGAGKTTLMSILTAQDRPTSGEASFDASSQGITIAVAAPSENLVGVVPGGGHVRWNGTSGAAPIVSGIAALVMAAHPELDVANVINRIVATARDAGAPGQDPIYGYGLVDAAAAVGASVPTVTANPMGELSDWITLYRRADSTPAPLPSGTPWSLPEPIPLAPASPLGSLLPTVNQLRSAGIPLAVFAIFAAIIAAAVVTAFRRFGAPRKGE